MPSNKYAVSRHGKTDEPSVAMRRLRLKAEALQELRGEIHEYMKEHAEAIEPLLRLFRDHDKLAREVRDGAKSLHTADFEEEHIEVGDFALTKMKAKDKWDVSGIYNNDDHGVFAMLDGVVTEISGDVVVAAVKSKKLPSRFLKYLERLEHPDFKVRGPTDLTPKV